MTLHYIYDPLCGWCYAAAPLVAVARELVAVRAHGGGMMAGPGRRPVTPALRSYVLPHDARNAELTGQPFGATYTDGLLRDETAVFDSEPPITAVLAADALGGRGLDLLARIQRAHYVEGQRIADAEVLNRLAADIGLDAEAFRIAYRQQSGVATQAHIGASRELLARVGGRGFPTLVLERDGRQEVIDVGAFLGQAERWRDWLSTRSGAGAPAVPGAAPFCGIEGC